MNLGVVRDGTYGVAEQCGFLAHKRIITIMAATKPGWVALCRKQSVSNAGFGLALRRLRHEPSESGVETSLG